jgi:hypothetical protein
MREPNLGRLLWVSIASVGPSWHVGFTPDFGRIAARQRTDAPGPKHKVAALQPAARGPEPRGR